MHLIKILISYTLHSIWNSFDPCLVATKTIIRVWEHFCFSKTYSFRMLTCWNNSFFFHSVVTKATYMIHLVASFFFSVLKKHSSMGSVECYTWCSHGIQFYFFLQFVLFVQTIYMYNLKQTVKQVTNIVLVLLANMKINRE